MGVNYTLIRSISEHKMKDLNAIGSLILSALIVIPIMIAINSTLFGVDFSTGNPWNATFGHYTAWLGWFGSVVAYLMWAYTVVLSGLLTAFFWIIGKKMMEIKS